MDGLEGFWREIPVFPLPNLVFMPGETLPLHVFEYRYRELVRHALSADCVLAMSTLKYGYQEEYYGSPPMWPEVGVGRIVAHQCTADGRYDLLLRFIAAGTVERELASEHSFRMARCQELIRRRGPDHMNRPIRVLLTQLGVARCLQVHPDLFDLRGDTFLDAVAREILLESDVRRRYLTEVSPSGRVELVQHALVAMLAGQTGAGLDA